MDRPNASRAIGTAWPEFGAPPSVECLIAKALGNRGRLGNGRMSSDLVVTSRAMSTFSAAWKLVRWARQPHPR
jgi:hypothetical protein